MCVLSHSNDIGPIWFAYIDRPPLVMFSPLPRQVNDLIANPHSAEASGGDLGGLQGLMGESVGRWRDGKEVVRRRLTGVSVCVCVLCCAGFDGRNLQSLLEGMDRQQIMELLNQGGLGGIPIGNLAGLTGSASPSRPSTGSRSRPDTSSTNQSQDPVSQADGGRGGSGASRTEQRSESSQQPRPRYVVGDRGSWSRRTASPSVMLL